jgi:hypothetical protein
MKRYKKGQIFIERNLNEGWYNRYIIIILDDIYQTMGRYSVAVIDTTREHKSYVTTTSITSRWRKLS